MKTVTIIGLGYVGLPLACLCAEKGHGVYGLEIKEEIVKKVNDGVSPLKDAELSAQVKKLKGKIKATTDASCIAKSDVVIICVPTPVDENYRPDLGPVEGASRSTAKNLRKGQLVIVESTIYPGVIEEVVQPILEESGMKAGKDFYLAHCPERIDPGNKKWSVRNIPRVVGGVNPESTTKAAEFYRSIIEADILELSSVKSAEAAKVIENAFRDINIAFANEIARSFDNLGIDVAEVIKAASTKPFGFMPHWPGCGVGGHCIPVDPYYLIEKARQHGFTHRFLSLAREINNGMPAYTVQKLILAMNDAGKSVNGSRVCVLGYAYKRDVDDIRSTPAKDIVERIKKLGAKVEVYEPFIPKVSTIKNMDECFSCDALVLVTDHTEFRKMDYSKLKGSKVKVIVDGRNALDREKIKSAGVVYTGIGRQ
jgi:UDP-N-acetyl-D-glucosamine dehydrogenase